MGLLVVVITIERRCWNWIKWLFLILWVVGGENGDRWCNTNSVLLLAGRRRINGVVRLVQTGVFSGNGSPFRKLYSQHFNYKDGINLRNYTCLADWRYHLTKVSMQTVMIQVTYLPMDHTRCLCQMKFPPPAPTSTTTTGK